MKALIGQCRVADDATAKTIEEGYSYVFSIFLSLCIYAMLRQQAKESDLDVHAKIILGPEEFLRLFRNMSLRTLKYKRHRPQCPGLHATADQ